MATPKFLNEIMSSERIFNINSMDSKPLAGVDLTSFANINLSINILKLLEKFRKNEYKTRKKSLENINIYARQSLISSLLSDLQISDLGRSFSLAYQVGLTFIESAMPVGSNLIALNLGDFTLPSDFSSFQSVDGSKTYNLISGGSLENVWVLSGTAIEDAVDIIMFRIDDLIYVATPDNYFLVKPFV